MPLPGVGTRSGHFALPEGEHALRNQGIHVLNRLSSQFVGFQAIPDQHDVHVVWARHVTNRFPRHTHRMFCMGIVDEGARVITRNRSTTVVPEGHLFVLNPEESHACGPLDAKGHSYRIVCTTTDYLQSVAVQVSGKKERVPRFRNVLLQDANLLGLARYFFSLLECGASPLDRESALMSLSSQLIRSHAEDAPELCRVYAPRRSVDRAREYIEAHFWARVSLEQLARIACLSPFHFQRVFVRVFGVSPQEYLTQFRLRKAREFLNQGLGILDTALETGFADQSHFTRLFKRAVGVTPGQYLQKGGRESSSM